MPTKCKCIAFTADVTEFQNINTGNNNNHNKNENNSNTNILENLDNNPFSNYNTNDTEYRLLIMIIILVFLILIVILMLSLRLTITIFFLSGFSIMNIHDHRTAGEGRGYSLSPLYHFHPLRRHLDISQAITAESSPLHIASSGTRARSIWFPRASR